MGYQDWSFRKILPAAVTGVICSVGSGVATATEPCDDFGECKVLIEINGTDGDIGFHFLMDGDDLNSARIHDPRGRKVFEDQAKGSLREQKLTETFAESAEPLCWPDPEADPEDAEDMFTLTEFRERWEPGTYLFSGSSDGGEKSSGESELTYYLPAAPQDLDFDGSVISWSSGDDLGNCAPLEGETLQELVDEGILGALPANVPVAAWEIVMEPDVDDGDPTGQLVYSIRVAGDINPREITVPQEYLDSLPDDTPVKIEVGAIGGDFVVIDDVVVGDDDNATFTEEDGFCVNVDEGCED